MEDFLRDSLGIVEESAMQEMSNASFTSVLAIIEEEDVNNEEVVEEETQVRDFVLPRRELPPSLQKLEAQRMALLKLGFDSDEGGDKTKLDHEELGAVDGLFERSITCDDEAFLSQETENCEANELLVNRSTEAGLHGVEEASARGMSGLEQVEERNSSSEGERVETEVQVDTIDNLYTGKEATELHELNEGVEVGESELQEEEGCLQSHVSQENAVIDDVENGGKSGIALKGVEGEAAGEGEEVGEKTSTSKNVGNGKNTSYDSGLSRSNDVSLVDNEREETVESEAVSGTEGIAEENPGSNGKVNVVRESFIKDPDTVEGDCRVAVAKEENESKVWTLKVKALAATSTTPPPELSVEAVMEDFSWFDCPGLKVTEVEDGLQVDVEDRQLGLAAMEGLKHKYLITQQVWNSVFSSSHLWLFRFQLWQILPQVSTH